MMSSTEVLSVVMPWCWSRRCNVSALLWDDCLRYDWNCRLNQSVCDDRCLRSTLLLSRLSIERAKGLALFWLCGEVVLQTGYSMSSPSGMLLRFPFCTIVAGCTLADAILFGKLNNWYIVHRFLQWLTLSASFYKIVSLSLSAFLRLGDWE